MFHFYLASSFILFLVVAGAPSEQESSPVDRFLPNAMDMLNSMLSLQNPLAMFKPSMDFMGKRQRNSVSAATEASFDAETCVFTANYGPPGADELDLSARVVGGALIIQATNTATRSSGDDDYTIVTKEASGVMTGHEIPPTCLNRNLDHIVQSFNKETGVFTVILPEVAAGSKDDEDEAPVESTEEEDVQAFEIKNAEEEDDEEPEGETFEIKNAEVEDAEESEGEEETDENEDDKDDAVKSQFNSQSLDSGAGATDGTKINEIISIMKL